MAEYRSIYKSSKQVVYSCHYHVVFSPKYRRSVLVDGIDIRLLSIIREMCEEHEVELSAVEVMPDHVHLLVEVHPQLGIHRFVKLLKGRSSRLLRQEFPVLKRKLPTLWTHSYFVSTTGGAPLDVMKQYVEQQKHV